MLENVHILSIQSTFVNSLKFFILVLYLFLGYMLLEQSPKVVSHEKEKKIPVKKSF
jgi:hypothetical protein